MRKRIRVLFTTILATVSVMFVLNLATEELRYVHHWKEAMTAVLTATLADKLHNCPVYFEALEIYRVNALLIHAWDEHSHEKVRGGSDSKCRGAKNISSLKK